MGWLPRGEKRRGFRCDGGDNGNTVTSHHAKDRGKAQSEEPNGAN